MTATSAAQFTSHPAAMTGATVLFDEAAVREHLTRLHEGRPFEIRAVRKRKNSVYTGYFDGVEAAVRAVARMLQDRKCDAKGWYTTLNSLNPDLLGRAYNRLDEFPDATTADHDAIGYRHLLIDTDPERPAQTSSTAAQLAQALESRERIRAYLADVLGWPAPLYAMMTGNGGTLVYRLALLPNTDETKTLVQECLETLQQMFGTDWVKVDQANFNPARITKLAGTPVRKGDDTPTRPHRMATAEYQADAGEVTEEQLRGLVAEYQADATAPTRARTDIGLTASPGARSWTVEQMLDLNGIGYHTKPTNYGVVYQLDRCVTSDAHDDGATIIEFVSGALAYDCQHNGCSGKKWADAKTILRIPKRAAAKAVTSSGVAPRNVTVKSGPHLVAPSRGAKAVTKAVIYQDDSLSTDERLSNPALWEALGCRLGSTVRPEEISWLWPNRIALRKVGLLEGDGGEGKSLLLCDLAARLSANLPMPDGSPNPFGRPVPTVLMMAEDGDEDTIIPRIMAAGGDPSRIILLKSVPDEDGGHFPTIPDDVDHIWHVCKAAGAGALIMDPVVSYLSAEVNTNNDHSVRRALARLPEMAEDVGMAVILVRHLNKNTSAEPKYRGGGSGAFLNLARTALAVGASPDDDTGTRRVLAVNKINVDKCDVSWAYHPETAYVRLAEDGEKVVKTAKLVWEGQSTFTAADILTAKPDPEERSAGEVCKQMLLELLAKQAHPERIIWQAISQARISESTYRRVRRTLNIHTWREGGLGEEGRWMLSLTPLAAKAVTPEAKKDDSLSKTPPAPDTEPLAPPAKAVTEVNDSDSERLRLAPSRPPLAPQCYTPSHRDADLDYLTSPKALILTCGVCHPQRGVQP